MDLIMQGLIKDFSKAHNIEKEPDFIKFEHLVNFAVVSQECNETFSPEDVHVGENSNQGIDGIGIIANWTLVNDESEIDDLIEINKQLDASYIFIQSKTSPEFDSGNLGGFIESVRDFFKPDSKLNQSESAKIKKEISKKIFNNSSKMRSNPSIKLFYVTTGNWKEDKNITARKDQGEIDLQSTGLFSSVKIQILGNSEIQSLYRRCVNVVTAEIDFYNHVTLPPIDSVSQAFLGFISATQLFKLIVDENDNIRRSVFEDNIRDFQGNSMVNAEINKTLTGNMKKSFVILNNGITVVCRDLKIISRSFFLTGYQIVNGCQTSNVIYNNKTNFNHDDVLIPLKLIHTTDDAVISSIIKATNSQNAVKPEDLEAITGFQKNLELFYNSFTGNKKLYYERRSQQYRYEPVEKTRIVTISSQIKSFASMILESPHRVLGYYGTIKKNLGDSIFKPDHKNLPYYTSSYASYRLDCLFRSKTLESKYKPIRWYLIFLFRHVLINQMSQLNSKKIEKECEYLLNILYDNEKAGIIFGKIIEKLSNNMDSVKKDTIKTQRLHDKFKSLFAQGEFMSIYEF